MKGSTVAFITLGVFNVGMAALQLAANKHAKAKAKVDAVSCRPEQAQAAFDEAKKRCDIFDNCKKKEELAVNKRLHDWKAANSFDEKKLDIVNSVKNGIENFKSSIGYSGEIDSIQAEFDAGLESFKASINYDTEKEALSQAIRDAKHHYEQQKVAFDIAGDDISDTTMKLRHAAEEAMNTKVKEATAKIEALENQVKTETARLTKIKTDKTRVLEEKVAMEKIRLDKQSGKDLEKLHQDLDSAKNDILKKVQKERSKDEVLAASVHEEDIRTLRLQKEADADLAKDILESRPNYERIAEYLTSKKVPKAVVAIVGFLPMIPVGYLCSKYITFVSKVVMGM